MTTAAERTLDLLARSNEDAAAAVLREALERTDDLFGVEAALAIGRHSAIRLKNDVLRMCDRLSARQKDALRHKTRAFANATMHGLRSVDRSDREQAIRWVAAVEDFERFPQLIGRLTGIGEAPADADESAEIALVCEQLVERMYDLTTNRSGLDDDGEGIRNAKELRESFSATLAEACTVLDRLPNPERVIEWTLILLDPETVAAQRLMNSLDPRDREQVCQQLLTGKHPGVMDLSWGLMKRGYPLPIAFDMWRQRQDEEFIWHVLETQPSAPSTLLIQNLQQVDYVPWLTGTPAELHEKLRTLPPALLPSVVSLMELISLPERVQKNILRWLLENGDATTRSQASEMFDLLGKQEAQQIVCDGLEHDDVEIQAWATGQLRPQDVPNAIRLLIERLDDPSETIREAAREELADFNFARMVQFLDTEPERVTPAMGRLILKIDPEAIESVCKELAHAIRGRRLAAIRTTVALGLCGEVLEAIAALLDDSDMLVRRTAAEALGTVPSRAAIVALERARHDESARVREAALEAMRNLRRALIAKARQEATQKSAEQPSEMPTPVPSGAGETP